MKIVVVTAFVSVILTGCAAAQPYIGQGAHLQITRGHPLPPLDFFGSLVSVPAKLLLWNWHFNDHRISAKTERTLVEYLERRNLPAFEDAQFRLNQYSPLQDLKAAATNRHVAWPYRIILGLPMTLIFDVLLPGRLIPWGDYYNAFSNTAHLYSDDAVIALHEAGHAFDFADFPHRGTYAALRLMPFIDLYQEWRASDEAVDYFLDTGDRKGELRAYRVLWPAYGTYLGSYFPLPFGGAAGAFIGHIIGRTQAHVRTKYYERMDTVLETPGRSMQGYQDLQIP